MKKSTLYIEKNAILAKTIIELPASKSIANRALILDALSGGHSRLWNISHARDTQTLQRLLRSLDNEWDVLDAGTTMRFLTAFAAVKCDHQILTGTPRMQERPIKILADALRSLGADIHYLKNEGYPPLQVTKLTEQLTDRISIRGDVSSQYISALMMIAPALPQGLIIELTGHIGSRPYINMTLQVMKAFGLNGSFRKNLIDIPHQTYQPTSNYTIEPDWSAASYWYGLVALCEGGEILLKDLQENSIQGDKKIANYMQCLGVETTFIPEGALLTKSAPQREATFNFSDCPDLAQTVAVVCALKGIPCKMRGLESLRIKETDRIAALQAELSKLGALLVEENREWELIPSQKDTPAHLTFETYHDHRMAMSLAPVSTQTDITIQDPDVVNKSYPHFWEDLSKAGFILSQI